MTHVFNEFKRAEKAGEIDLATDDIRASWHMTNTTIDTENDGIATNTDFTTPDEFDGANYTANGFALASKTVTKSDSNDRGVFDAADISAGAQAAGTRAVAGILIYKFVTNWASSIPICWLTLSFTANGSTVTIQWDADGILYSS